MKTTLSIIKADIGSIGGHIRPSQRLLEEVRNDVASKGKGFVSDFFISHTGPLMPVKMNSSISYFDGPPAVCSLGFCVHNGKFTEPADAFDHPYWDWVRNKVAQKATDIRQQGFSGAAMLPYAELEYGGIVEKMGILDKKFKIRK